MAFGADGLQRSAAHPRISGRELEEAAHALHTRIFA